MVSKLKKVDNRPEVEKVARLMLKKRKEVERKMKKF